jgi:hypothetical protein
MVTSMASVVARACMGVLRCSAMSAGCLHGKLWQQVGRLD